MKRSLGGIIGLCMFFVGGLLASSAWADFATCPSGFPGDPRTGTGWPGIRCPSHMHQLSKDLVLQQCDVYKECEQGIHGDCATLKFKHALTFIVESNCYCDETALEFCSGAHCGDTNCSTDGIPELSLLKVRLTTLMKKDISSDDRCILGGFHRGDYRLCSSDGSVILAKGKMSGVNGVKPSVDRPYTDADGTICLDHTCYLPDHIIGCFEWPGGFITFLNDDDGDPATPGVYDSSLMDNFCPPSPPSNLQNRIQIRACYEGDLSSMFSDVFIDGGDQDACADSGSTLRLEGVVYIYSRPAPVP